MAISVSTLVQAALAIAKNIWTRFRNLGPRGKAFVGFLGLVYAGMFSLVFYFGPAKIFQTLYDFSRALHDMPGGWLILGGILVLSSFPPLVGHSTCLSLCGFAYGLQGFFIAAPAAIIGSALSFVILRKLFKARISKWSRQNKKWTAMEEVVKAKGMPLIILIRISPIPWVYNTAFFASIESVSLLQLIVATFFLFPKILLIIFVGSQVGDMSDGTHRNEMSPLTKALNVLSIIISILVAVGTGWFVWRTTSAKIRHIEDLPAETDRLAEEFLDEVNAPLLYSPMSPMASPRSDASLNLDNEYNPLDEVVDKLTGRTAPDSV